MVAGHESHSNELSFGFPFKLTNQLNWGISRKNENHTPTRGILQTQTSICLRIVLFIIIIIIPCWFQKEFITAGHVFLFFLGPSPNGSRRATHSCDQVLGIRLPQPPVPPLFIPVPKDLEASGPEAFRHGVAPWIRKGCGITRGFSHCETCGNLPL